MFRVIILLAFAGAIQTSSSPDWSSPLNGSTNYLPRWSPDGTRLVFDRRTPDGWRVHLTNVNGSGVRQITSGPGNDYQAAWSPDGGSLVFDSDRDGDREIFALQLADGTITQLTKIPARDVMPAWSPDGREIAFVSDRDGTPQVWVMARDGSAARRVTHGLPKGGILRPMWSPDGAHVAFAAEDETTKRRRIYIVDQDGANLRPVTPPGDAANPAWSPDGKRLVFDASTNDNDDSSRGEWELWVVNMDGTDRHRLTNNSVNDWGPSWSPDGRRIAFCRGLQDQYEIFVMAADGSDERRVTRLVFR